MLELEPLLPGRHACTPGRRCRSVPAVYPVTAAVIARASARFKSTAHVRRWRPALAGHPAERRPPDRRKPLPRGGEGKGLLRDVRLPARAAYIAIMSQLTRTCQSRVDARHRTRGRVAVGPGQGGLCQAAWLTVTVKPLADPEKVRLIRRSERVRPPDGDGDTMCRTDVLHMASSRPGREDCWREGHDCPPWLP